jgi:putative ABC transport system permease protein
VKAPPIMGRGLTEADAQPGAPPVIVIAHSLWRSRFASDPDVVGRVVTLGDSPATVVGVMPEGVKFPANQEAWLPLRLDETAKPRDGMELRVWARLKAGVSRSMAAAEFETLGAQAAADWPATHAHVRPEVNQFAGPEDSMRLSVTVKLLLASVNLAVGMLILLISSNVALLMFARAATRDAEVIVRSALGASRGRIITQFFSEALVLCGVALVFGLALARNGIRWAVDVFTMSANGGEPLPFWFTPTLPPLSIAYAVGLAVLAAVVTGVLPALKVTRGLSSRLRETSAGGGGLQFSGVWTVVIVAQIALTVTFPVVTYFIKRDGLQIERMDIGVPASEYLSARLARDRDTPPEQYEAAVREIRDGLAAVPGVTRVTIADKLPLMWHGHYDVDVDEGGSGQKEDGRVDYRISMAAVDTDYFAAFAAQPLAGRLLTSADYTGKPRVAVVNQSFVRLVLGGRNPIGRRVRYTNVENGSEKRTPAVDGDWMEIVGLVRDLGMANEADPKIAGIYLPLDIKTTPEVYVGARISGDFAAASAALRRLGAKADVTLRVTEMQPLDQVTALALAEISFWTRLMASVSFATLMLSLTGIYAVMSFAVSKRTREIGIRMALGSDRTHVVFAVLKRPLLQVVGGIVVGAMLSILLGANILTQLGPLLIVIGYSLVMLCVCLLASLVPVRRALRINPTEALRNE